MCSTNLAPLVGHAPLQNGNAPAWEIRSVAEMPTKLVRTTRRLPERAHAGAEARPQTCSSFLFWLEYVAIEDCRHTKVGHIHELGDIKINNNTCKDVSLLAR